MVAELTKAFINGISVSNGDVYVIGAERDINGKLVAKYWKNGEEVILSDHTDIAQVNAIQVINDDVYAAGYEFDFKTGSQTAVYWVNGRREEISDAKDAYLHGITIVDEDIFLVGTARIGGLTRPMIWKNGEAIHFDIISSPPVLYQ